jgi:hypothetical protein
MKERLPAWNRVRALLIALAMASALVDGCPLPTARVRARLAPSLQQLSDRLYDAQRFALLPVQPIKDAFTIGERWALFSSTGGIRYRMWIEAVLLYRAKDEDHTYLRDTLEFRRVLNVWNPSRAGKKASYDAFASWVSRTTMLREPRFEEVRVSMERGRILDRGEAFVPLGTFDDVEVHRRDEVAR